MSDEIAKPGGRQAIEWPLELRERGYRLYVAKKPLAEIAKELGVPFNTLTRWSSESKWKLRRAQDLTAGVSNINAVATVEPTVRQLRAPNQSFETKQEMYRETMADEALRIAETISAMPAQTLLSHADKIAKLDQVARKALHLEDVKPSTVIQIGYLTNAAPMPIKSDKYLTSIDVLPLVESTG